MTAFSKQKQNSRSQRLAHGRALWSAYLLLVPIVGTFTAFGQPYFEVVTSEAGLNHVHQRPDTSALSPREQEQFYLTGGAAAGDFDDDGWTDLFFTRPGQSDLLYRNNQDGTFTDVSSSYGFTSNHNSNGAAWGDIDNDRDLDLYVTTLDNRNLLYLNTGDGFIESASIRNVEAAVAGNANRAAFSPSFGDYDRDGYIDLYTTNWGFTEENPVAGSSASRLYQNLASSNPGFFSDRTVSAGVALESSTPALGAEDFVVSFSSSFTDVTGDGLPDLAIAGDFGNSRLFENNADGTFTDTTTSAGVGIETNGMGSTFGDFDNDDLLDPVMTNDIELPGTLGSSSAFITFRKREGFRPSQINQTLNSFSEKT